MLLRRKVVVFLLILSAMLFSGCKETLTPSGESGVISEISSEEGKKSEENSSDESEEKSEEIKNESVPETYETIDEYIRHGFADAVEKASKSVVSVTVTKNQNGGFFGDYSVEEDGSGVIVTKSGHIVTNFHVVDNAQTVNIIFSDGKEIEAEIVGMDRKTDLAVLKLKEDAELVPATFSTSSNIRRGDFVFAIGNALGKYPESVTMGIVSAVSRNVSISGEEIKMVQTDAALNSGNSGGGLFDSYGNIIGIVAAKDANSEAEGVGFAIQSDVVKNVVDEIITHGYVTGRPSLGFDVAEITSLREASYYGVDWIGVYISSVDKNSFGEKAGIKPRDYIYSVNGETVTTEERLEEILKDSRVGDTLILEIWRGTESMDVLLIVGEEGALNK